MEECKAHFNENQTTKILQRVGTRPGLLEMLAAEVATVPLVNLPLSFYIQIL